jgi:hypothetical protein
MTKFAARYVLHPPSKQKYQKETQIYGPDISVRLGVEHHTSTFRYLELLIKLSILIKI